MPLLGCACRLLVTGKASGASTAPVGWSPCPSRSAPVPPVLEALPRGPVRAAQGCGRTGPLRCRSSPIACSAGACPVLTRPLRPVSFLPDFRFLRPAIRSGIVWFVGKLQKQQEPPWPPTHTRHLSPHCRCLTGPVHWPSLCAAGSPVPSWGARQGRACPGDRGRPAWASGRWATCCLFSGASSGPGCLLSRPRQSLATGPSPEAPGRHLLPSACAWPLGAQGRASRRARPSPDQPPRGLPRLLVVPGTLLGPRSRPQCPLPRTPGWSSCEDTPPPARGCAWLHPAVLCLGVPSLVSLSHAGAELRLAWGSPLPGQGRAGSVSHGLALLAG